MYIIIDDEPERFVDARYPGLKNNYEISNYGNVRNKKTGKLKRINSRDQDGYIRGTFKAEDGTTMYIYLHRLVAFNFCDGYDETTDKIFVNHLDTIRDHNYYKNLEWTTQSENNKHSYRHGSAKPHINHLYGESNGFCVYSDELTHQVCKLFADGFDVPDVMEVLGYSKCGDNLKLYYFLRHVKKRRLRKNISAHYNF